MISLDRQALREWIGRSESAVDHITIPAVQRLAATLDRDDPAPRAGDVLPTGWHGVLFPRVVKHSQLGRDGHPQRGDFVPPVPLPRRMNGGRRIVFRSDLRVGDEVRRESVVSDVQLRTARSGDIVVVTIRTDIHSPRGLAVTEEQDILYRGEPEAGAAPPAPKPAPRDAKWQRTWTPDPVMLFRFSALTFNGHRIHYDAPYVTRVEGYPGLIVNGGLSALLLFELARECAGARPLAEMSMRNTRAMYVNQPLTVCGKPVDERRGSFWIADCDGALAVAADFVFAERSTTALSARTTEGGNA